MTFLSMIIKCPVYLQVQLIRLEHDRETRRIKHIIHFSYEIAINYYVHVFVIIYRDVFRYFEVGAETFFQSEILQFK